MATDRNLWGAARAFAGSRNLSVLVLVTASTYVLVLATFGMLVETRWLDIIAGLYPFVLLYALFIVNLIACGDAWLPTVVRRCKREAFLEPTGKTTRLERAVEVSANGLRTDDLKAHLRRRGFAVRDTGDGGDGRGQFHAIRGRFSGVGNLLFHAGFLLLAAGAVTNTLTRFAGTAIIAEGGSFTGAESEYRTVAEGFTGPLPKVDFDVGRITAEFWEGKVFFTRLEAQVVHRGGREVAALSSPVGVGEAQVTIAGFGYVPTIELKNREGQTVSRAQVRMNLFPPGTEDYFYVPGYPHKVFVAFFPDHAQVNGRHVSRSMNPANPAYFVRVLRGRIPVYAGLVRPGEWAEFDGLRLAFPSFARSGDFRIVRNPGHPLVWAAFLAMALGLAWRLICYRREIVYWQDDAGRAWLSGHFDYFPRLNGDWLEGLAGEFGGKAR